jgi:thioester reductase-like protein
MGIRDTGGMESPDLQWLTYRQVQRRMKALACGLHAKLRGEMGAESMVGICGENCVEWLIVDLACILTGCTSIPIDPPLDEAAIGSMLADCELRVIFCSDRYVSKILRVAGQEQFASSLTTLVVFGVQQQDGDANIEEHDSRAQAIGIRLVQFTKLEQLGISLLDGKARYFETDACQGCHRQPDDICTVVFTSGSTGKPKGAMLSDQVLRRRIGGLFLAPDPLVVVSYLPLAHSFDRENCLNTLQKGGRIAFHIGPISDIFDTLQLARPTTFSSTPRLWNELHQQFLDSLSHSLQEHASADGPVVSEPFLRSQCLAKLGGILGGRTKSIGTGGAAIAPEVLQFMRDCFRCGVVDGYGATEVGAIGWDGVQNTSCETKLLDRPDMGYRNTDKPYPRGEICVRSPTSVVGYYKNAAETKAKFADGWYKTGDIGEKRSEGYLRIIDRVSDLFKLSGGEFVAPARLEQLLQADVQLISQIWITGLPHEASPVALVVPAATSSLRWACAQGPPLSEMSLRELCQEPHGRLTAEVVTLISTVVAQRKLPTHERPRHVLLVPEPFSEENGMLTTTRKLQRRVLAREFAAQVELLYDHKRGGQAAYSWETELESIADGPMRKIFRAASLVLTLPPALDTELSTLLLSDWMADSVTAVRLASAINTEFGRNARDPSRLRPSVLLDPAATLAGVCERMTQPKIHAPCTSSNNNWELEGELPSSFHVVDAPPAEAEVLSHSLHQPQHILLTGATGFLGAFTLAELLISGPAASIITCLARGAADASARVRDTLSGYGLLSCAMANGYATRVKIWAADIASPNLGVPEQKLVELFTGHGADAPPIDAIIHCAARVSSVAPYSALKPTNVEGTLQLLQLAAARPAGSVFFCHVSTIGVLQPFEGHSAVGGTAHLDVTSGYNQSKWVAERRVIAAFQRGLAGCIVRPANIFGHSDSGASNSTDMVVRLLRGVLELGAAPQLPPTSALGSSKHVQDITAVDDVARVVVGTLLPSLREQLLGLVMNVTAATPTPTLDLFAWVGSYQTTKQGGRCGALKRMPHSQWLAQLHKSSPTNALRPFTDMLAHGVPMAGTAGRDRAYATKIIAQIQPGGGDFRPITESAVHAALEWLTASK